VIVLTEPEQEFAGMDVKGFVDAFSILVAQELMWRCKLIVCLAVLVMTYANAFPSIEKFNPSGVIANSVASQANEYQEPKPVEDVRVIIDSNRWNWVPDSIVTPTRVHGGFMP